MNLTSRWTAFAATAAATLLIALAFAGTAQAACPRTVTVTIHGVGSSLQKVAQERVWIPSYRAVCGEITPTYDPRGSGAGIEAWKGAEGTAERSGDQFIATDDPITPAQREEINRGAKRQGIALIPVAQAAIAVIINLPEANCRIGPAGREITNAALERIWKGAFRNWEEVEANCRGRITRIVRLGVSGTTAEFKHYLWLILKEVIGGHEWLLWEENALNTSWPSAIVSETEEGGSALVREVNATTGSIGYVNFADALAVAGTLILKVQNDGLLRPSTYASPEDGARNANCLRTAYYNHLGVETLLEGREPRPVQVRQPLLGTNWEEIYGSNPEIGLVVGKEEAYPICALTFIGVILSYQGAGFPLGVGLAVRSYLLFIIEEVLGNLRGHNYSGVPTEFRAGNRTITEGIAAN